MRPAELISRAPKAEIVSIELVAKDLISVVLKTETGEKAYTSSTKALGLAIDFAAKCMNAKRIAPVT